MPTLELEGWQDKPLGNYFAGMHVLAIMYYPRDAALREEFWVWCISRLLAAWEEHGQTEVVALAKTDLCTPGFFSVLARVLSKGNMAERNTQAGSYGIIAGDMLLHIIQLEKYGYGGSVNKAVHLLELIYSSSVTRGERAVPASQTALRNAWAQYHPVAHLWAAARVTEDSFFMKRGMRPNLAAYLALSPELEKERLRQFFDDFPLFLAMAEAFRQFGIDHIPKRGIKVPLLSPNETWSCEGTVPLPAIQIPVPPLTEPAPAVLILEINWYRPAIRVQGPGS
jgi:hypothetical protein